MYYCKKCRIMVRYSFNLHYQRVCSDCFFSYVAKFLVEDNIQGIKNQADAEEFIRTTSDSYRLRVFKLMGETIRNEFPEIDSVSLPTGTVQGVGQG